MFIFFRKKLECDFIIPNKEAIQVAWELNKNNEKSKVEGLIEALKYFNLKNGLILTYNQEGNIKIHNYTIKILPVWKYLLSKSL